MDDYHCTSCDAPGVSTCFTYYSFLAVKLPPLLGQMFQQARTFQSFPTLPHAFALPPHPYNAMGKILLKGLSRNSSALPRGAAALKEGEDVVECQERGGPS